MTDGYESAERVRDSEGRQYHVGLAPGEVARWIMLVGDPARADRVSTMFDEVRLERRNREYVSFTGNHRGLEITVVGTGIGPDNMEIAVIELSQCVERPTFIRCGTCGGLQPQVRLGELVISRAAYRLENTSLYFVGEGYPAASDPQVVLALIAAADGAGHAYHVGITATAPGFYGAQGRSIPGFPVRDPNLVDDLRRQGVLNMEMEVSSLLTLASLRGCPAGAVCVVFAARDDNVFIDPADKGAAELRCVETGLQAFHILAEQERARGDRTRWYPGIGS